MKLTLSLVACLIATSSWATVITVSNTPNFPAMFTDAQVAIDAAADGDTVQVYPSINLYSDITITHGITLIGAGLSTNFRTSFSRINCGTTAAVKLIGLNVSIIGEYSQVAGSNWEVQYCSIDYIALPGVWNNVSIRNCPFINSVYGIEDDNGVFFSNNVFGNDPTQYNGIGGSSVFDPSQPSVFFANNYFKGDVAFYANNAVFVDNVFNVVGNSGSCHSCVFQNNYTLCQTCAIANIEGALPANNIENGPSPFVNDVADLHVADLHLAPGSSAIGAGSNGGDIGLHDGLYPPSEGLHYGLFVPGLPVIDLFTIVNPIIEQNGQLQIQAVSSIPVTE